MAGLPNFLVSTQEDPAWEISLFDTQGAPLSLEGRTFIAIISPATVGAIGGGTPAEIKVLRFGDGLTLSAPTDGSGNPAIKNTLIHQVSREFAQANFPRGELTADILEVTDGSRRTRFIPVRLRYDDPAANREFSNTAAGVSFVERRQPIVTTVAVAGQPGRRGAGFLTGSGLPAPQDGEDGDYWIDSSAEVRTLYGPKAGGVWPSDGKPITSELTPELQAARDAAVAAASDTQINASVVAADRQAVDAGAAQVEGARQIIVTAQEQVSQDATASAASREAARLARDAALQAQAAADGQRLAAQYAANDARQYASLANASAFDFNFDSDPSPSNDWNV